MKILAIIFLTLGLSVVLFEAYLVYIFNPNPVLIDQRIDLYKTPPAEILGIAPTLLPWWLPVLTGILFFFALWGIRKQRFLLSLVFSIIILLILWLFPFISDFFVVI